MPLLGEGMTDSSGVGAPAGAATTDASGTDMGGVVASCSRDIHFKSTHATGDLAPLQSASAELISRLLHQFQC